MLFHEYEKVVLIRIRFMVNSEGERFGKTRVDTDIDDMPYLVGLLEMAKQDVLAGRYYSYEEFRLTGAPEFDDEEEPENDD